MDFIRPAYCYPARLPDRLKAVLEWPADMYDEAMVGPAPKPSSREDGVYCISCALWDIDGQSRQYKPKPAPPKSRSRDPMAFHYNPANTNFRRMLVHSAALSSAPGANEAGRAKRQPEKDQIKDFEALNLGSESGGAEAIDPRQHQSEPPETPSQSAKKDQEAPRPASEPPVREHLDPALDHDADTFEYNPVHVNFLLWLKTHEHFCRLCHLLLSSLQNSPELDHPPWGDSTAVYVERFEFATLYDDDKIREDAESRPKPRHAGFDASVMGMLYRVTAMREAKADAVPERLAYRFNVRLDERGHPSVSNNRRYGIQRFESALNSPGRSPFSGLQGRKIGGGNERMRRWLDWSTSCIERHLESCIPNVIRDDYPNLRLVDVRRRCIVEGLESRTYTALSYVWGTESKVVLKRSNFFELHRRGALSEHRKDIPKTIRDVLNLCENVSTFLRQSGDLSEMDMLSLVAWDYIWIDALCIVQDDPEDKQHHINRMDKVYSGAWQTIVAAGQGGADAGLPGVGKEIPLVEQVVEEIDGVPFVATKQSFLTALKSSQWEARGWTFQEKHISKRLLVFTDEQCFWHCSCATWYEDTNLELPNKTFPHLRAVISHPEDPTNDPKKHLKWHPDETDVDRYRMLADSYVRRKLTYNSDGLDSINAVLTSLIDKNESGGRSDRSRDTMNDVLWSPSKRKYFWAVPEIYLSAFLLTNWSTEDPWSERRAHYPTWSWLSRSLIDAADEVTGFHIPQFEVTPRESFYRFDENGRPVMLECVMIHESGLTASEDTFDNEDDKRANIPSIVLVESLAEADRLNKQHAEEGKNILALDESRTPPISHLLAFREVTCKLWVDTDPIELKPGELCEAAPDSVIFEARFEENGPCIGYVHLHRVWRRRQPQWLDFVVVNEAADFVSTRCLNLLLIEWDGPIARRVQVSIAMKINEASKAQPVEKKLILLA